MEKRKIRLTKPMLAVWVLVGATVVYFSSWIGPVAFYYRFQKPLQAGTYSCHDGVIWSWPRAVATAASPGWDYQEHEGGILPIPPARFKGFKQKDWFVVGVCDEGEILYRRFPPAFLRELFCSELEKVDGVCSELPDEVTLLADIVRVNPDSYSFGWSLEERAIYAAQLLSKMRLWDDRPVHRMEIAERSEPPGTSVLVEYADGTAKIVATTTTGTLVIMLPIEAPPSWKASPAFWLPPTD